MMDYRMENKGMRFLSLFPLSDKLFFLSFNPMVLSRLPALVLEDNKHKEEEGKRAGEKERCSGSYCQAVVFLVIKHDSISLFSGVWSLVSFPITFNHLSFVFKLCFHNLISRAWNNFRFLSRPHLKEKKDKICKVKKSCYENKEEKELWTESKGDRSKHKISSLKGVNP